MNEVTDYGFTWGPIEVARLFEHNGRRVVRVATERHSVEVYVSPQGQSVRVYIDGAEAPHMTAPPAAAQPDRTETEPEETQP